MNRWSRLVLSLLVFGMLGGCIIEEEEEELNNLNNTNNYNNLNNTNSTLTCDNFEDFLSECMYECNVTWDCELNYADLDIDTQLDLDDCSDCLVANLDEGFCDDCSVNGIDSCHLFMEDFLDVECWD